MNLMKTVLVQAVNHREQNNYYDSWTVPTLCSRPETMRNADRWDLGHRIGIVITLQSRDSNSEEMEQVQ